MALIDHVNWNELDALVTRQQRNRSAHAPVISLFRWWARRSHSFAGALLDAAGVEFRRSRFLVADPFSGGGTVAFEAARRGLPIYAQDLYPWPSQGLATALTPADPDKFKKAATDLLQELRLSREGYLRAEGNDRWEITHIIRVRKAECPSCSRQIFLFRDALISLASRGSNEIFGFFGCSGCGSVTRRKKDVQSFSCENCGTRSRTQTQSSKSAVPDVRCLHCRKVHPLSTLLLSPPQWQPVLVREQNLSDSISRIRNVESADSVEDEEPSFEHPLRTPIPDGLETSGLKRYGFSFWSQLYTTRQLTVLTNGLQLLSQSNSDTAVKRHLRLAILGATEMAGYLCRWERFHPKALEGIANHRFSRSTIAVETNLLSPSGRGTLPRRFQAVEKALRWMKSEGYPARTTLAVSSARRQVVNGALIVTGSSERQILRKGAAQLVFTDPPYHDDLQYGELARLFHAWMDHAGQCDKPLESAEAVPNSVRGTTTEDYEAKVAACLNESRRALAATGRLVLTFHNKDMKAWRALSQALYRADFDVVALAVVAAENAADHSKRGKESFLSDLVIECRPKTRRRRRSWNIKVHGITSSHERKNLKAIGLALAEHVNRGEGAIETFFDHHIKRLLVRNVLIRHGGR
jgi:16S rRNA G966 N2-methylase RsmD